MSAGSGNGNAVPGLPLLSAVRIDGLVSCMACVSASFCRPYLVLGEIVDGDCTLLDG